MKFPIPLILVLLLSGVFLRAEERWQSLWDGKTLAGWHVIGNGMWKIEDGAIHGMHTKAEQEFGHLVSDQTYTDFTIRLKFKSVKGNSGLYFRSDEVGYGGVSGFQAEIDALVDVGGLYETNGRNWVSQPSPDAVTSWFKPGEWNEMIVSARGGHITVRINGKTSAELKSDPGRSTGKFALQLHARQDCEVWFKDLEIQVPDKTSETKMVPNPNVAFYYPGPFTSTAEALVRREEFPIPAGSYGLVTLDMDVIAGPWYAANPAGWHNLFWMVRNGRNSELLGYAALRHSIDASPQVMLRQGIGVTHPQKTKQIQDVAIIEGKNYHLSYRYDIVGGSAVLVVTQGRKEVARLTAVPLLNPVSSVITFAPGDKLTVDLSTTSGENKTAAPEAPSVGWTYRSLNISLYSRPGQ